MKTTLRNTLIALFTCSSSAFAAVNTADTDGGLMVSIFIGFFSLIIIFQLVPATLMLIGMLKGIFSRESEVQY